MNRRCRDTFGTMVSRGCSLSGWLKPFDARALGEAMTWEVLRAGRDAGCLIGALQSTNFLKDGEFTNDGVGIDVGNIPEELLPPAGVPEVGVTVVPSYHWSNLRRLTRYIEIGELEEVVQEGFEAVDNGTYNRILAMLIDQSR